jgi:TPR repeat protein
MRTYILIALTCLLFSPALTQASLADGMAAYERGDYPRAYTAFLQAAQKGDVYAQGKLGGLYLYGVGVEKDYIQAYAWLSLAARQGDTSAEKFRDAVADQLTIPQLREAAVLAEDYYDQYVLRQQEQNR